MEFHNSHLPVLLLGGVSSGVRSACGKDGVWVDAVGADRWVPWCWGRVDVWWNGWELGPVGRVWKGERGTRGDYGCGKAW